MKRTQRVLSRPQWIVDDSATHRNGGRQIDWSLIPPYYKVGSYQIEVTANAAADATSVSVVAIPENLPVGTVLYFAADKVIRLTAPAVKGATALTVEALVTALADGDLAWVPGAGSKHIFSGTVMCEIAATKKVVPRAVRPGSETAVYLIETDADEDSPVAALSGYGMLVGAFVNENLLPEATGSPKVINSTWKTELGSWFKYQQYGDSRT